MKNQNGLTLIEMMVTLAVAIILVAVGIPAFRSITANNRAVAQSNALVTALNLSRGEAVKRGAPVTICRAANGACDDESNDWASGWLVFEDSDSSGDMNDGEPSRAPVLVSVVVWSVSTSAFEIPKSITLTCERAPGLSFVRTRLDGLMSR